MKRLIIWLIVGLVLISVLGSSGKKGQIGSEVSYAKFIDLVSDRLVRKVVIDGRTVIGEFHDGNKFITYSPNDPHMVDDLLDNGVDIIANPPKESSLLGSIFISWFPILLLIGVWIWYMKRQGGQGKFKGKNKAKKLEQTKGKVTFADVAGVEEALDEVSEMVDFLRNPPKYIRLGAKIPKGALMVGPPGTGKTLLARAIAGEAEVPFFSISGSDFVEMFVGVGASRVRDMFAEARKSSPCIIFIDEIDAVGRQRGAGHGGGNDEREQTLNQLLVEMDGFDDRDGIIVLGATNRADVLDKALLRPGRFDREINVGLPDVRGRGQILQVHMRRVPISNDIKLEYIAQGTTGFSGAELANLINEAALFAAKEDKENVCMADLERAKDKLIMGVEKKTMVMGEDEKRMTAYHEAGHAIVGRLTETHDPVYKVSIMPRGRALGVTMFLPEKDSYSSSKEKLESQLQALYGGRIAEELIYGKDKVTTGASNDIERATSIARNMVKRWGLCDAVGPLCYEDEQGDPFMGRSMGQPAQIISPEISKLLDEEVIKLTKKNYDKAKKILEDNMDILHSMTECLMEYETIDKYQLDDLLERKDIIREPQGYDN
jgi:cell division protease FtsH